MKASELRIGNWVQSDEMDEPIQINAHQLVHMTSLKGLLSGFVEPIPLTEEWLLKFGLLQSEPEEIDGKTRFYGWIKGTFNLEIQDSGEIWFEVYSHYIHVKHVHQLQNLYFALTGEELELK